MTDVQTFDQPSVEDVLTARERAVSTAVAHNQIEEGLVGLYDPEYESMSFGDGADGEAVIQFGPKGGFEPNVWVGPADHPLLPKLLATHPLIFEIGAPNEVYVCPDCPQKPEPVKFRVLAAYREHQTVKHPRVVKE